MRLPRLAQGFLTASLATVCAVVPSASASATSSSSSASNSSEWRFTVLLDDKPIGYHHFTLIESGAARELRSEARFKVKLLFVTVYRYEHDADERWQGECLATLEARTNDNGKSNWVRGARNASQFAVATQKLSTSLAPCVQTFAYWNPQMLTATQLLNPQTGDYVAVLVTHTGVETLSVRGREIAAERYRLVSAPTNGESATDPLEIDLWYSTDRNPKHKQWLALESIAAGGGRLRYQLQ